MTSAPTAGRARNIFTWVAAQLGQFLGLLCQMLFWGVVRAMLRRQFHGRAFAITFVTMLVGITAVGAALFLGPSQVENQDLLLWGGVMLVMVLAGLLGGRVGRRVAFWEIYLATLATALVLAVHLAKGWQNVLHIGPGDSEAFLDFVTPMAPGVHLLGPMWDRLLALGAVGGFLMAVLGGSFGFLLYGDTGHRDAAVDMEWRVALRHLSGRRSGLVSVTAVVAVIGVALGVASLVTVTAVMSGYQDDIQTKILNTNAHLVVQKYGVDFTEYQSVIDTAKGIPGVADASPFTFNEAMLSTGAQGVGVLLKGIVPADAGRVTGIEGNLCETMLDKGGCQRFADSHGALGRMLNTADTVPGIIVGAALYQRLKIPIGTVLTLTTPVGIAGARGNAPKRMEFRLVGVFRSGMHEFDSRLVYLDLSASQRFMGMGKAVNGVEFRVTQPERVDGVGHKVLSALGRYPYRTLDWRELNSGIFTALKLQKIVMFLVLTFIIIVAAFNIASTLFMAVVEKARDIAVLKSMGARDASIMKIFVLQGWLTGGVGTTLGVLLGLCGAAILSELQIAIAADVYMVETLQVHVRPAEVAITVLSALVISHLATLYPALKAARQHPVDAMRYD